MIVVSWIFFIFGFFFIITSTVGIWRFHGLYSKFHAAGIAEALGMPLIIFGILIENGFAFINFKILFIMIIVWVTSSISSYTIASACYQGGKK